jgi:cytochrome c oxidase assembly protein subunit 15
MPFDVNDFPGASRLDRAATRQSRLLVSVWLFSVAGMIGVMIILGGATRLTGSGLSIMEWAPIMGVLPPLNQAQWQHLFALYKEIPQYSLVNHGFGLAGFKQIFWLEWMHRLWGRLMGLVFLLPLIALGATGRIERRLMPRLVGLFLLGGLQGAVGWFMVESGFLPDTTSVAPSRLVVHLALALVLYAAIVWTALSTLSPSRHKPASLARVRRLAIASAVLVACTIVAGGFVAGTHAGLIDNTFPLMDGRIVPPDYAMLHPFWRNPLQNLAAVQFDHRALATATLLVVSITAAVAWRSGLSRSLSACLLAAVLCQYGLGVATLLLVVPIPVAVAHQTGAVVLLTVILLVVHRTFRSGTHLVRRLAEPAEPAPT